MDAPLLAKVALTLISDAGGRANIRASRESTVPASWFRAVTTPFLTASRISNLPGRGVDAVIEGRVDGLTGIASSCEGVYLTEAERIAIA